jgi:DNA-binding transcriptional LysR family regulator
MRSTWHVAPLLRDGRLMQVLSDIPTRSADIHALYSAAARVPRRVRELVAHLADRLAERIEPF